MNKDKHSHSVVNQDWDNHEEIVMQKKYKLII